ncbi:efflux RND transporter permease subunit [Thermoflexibacter ruber]|uniref:Multidrug efflux pump subunit AcrB n=1 Tax=Thermoflexibacter ruber TaxID=1003 RepID=A0A1I2I7D9_9BACT|nr:efflux RND transporter permease subunit [Thermoflexibacter ruber]SFF37510.1 Multidrug efflux pump subunit AcrB [Thermoflexibacter ruber]
MKLAEFSVKNYQFTIIIFIAVMVLGVSSLLNMPRGEDPPFNGTGYPIIAVYPGASPTDMEELVVEPIEDRMYELEDIKKIITTISDGLAVIIVEFNHGVNVDDKKNEVVREITNLRSTKLPADLFSLEVRQFQSSNVNILQCAIISETAPYSEMEKKADELKKRLEKIKTLKNVEIHAFPKQEVKISIDLERMAQNKMGLNRVLGAIQAENINIPSGSVDIATKKYNVKTGEDFAKLDEIKNVVVHSSAGKIVYLKDIAEVMMGYEDETYIGRFNGKRAVFITASLKDRKNILQTREAIEPILAKFEKEVPAHLKFVKSFDQAEGVSRRLSGLGRDFMIAIVLVLITLVPLGWRASVVVMISIPLSLAIGLALLDFLDYTINQLSIVGMVIALGLLVDDSIVVVENIERFLRMGYNRKQAAIEATKQIGLAILGCTAVLILAFLPLSFLPESAGDFIRSLPMAVSMTVLASLFVALTIIPFLSSQILKDHEQAEGNWFLRAFKKYINEPYRYILEWGFAHPVLTLLLALGLFVGSLFLIPSIGFSVFPKSEKPMFLVNIEAPLGTNLYETNRIAKYAEQEIMKIKEVKSVTTNVGKGNPRIYYNVNPQNESSNFAQLFVQLEHLKMTQIEKIVDDLRAKFKDYAGANIEVKQFEQGPPVDAPISIRIFGDNLDSLRALAFKLEDLIKKTEGTIYVKNPLQIQKTDLKVVINKDKAGMLGVPSSEIAKTVRLGIAGLNVGNFRADDGDEYKINVSVEKDKNQILEVFSKIYVTSLSGALIPLSNLATVELQTSAPTIQHYNKDRFVAINAFTKIGYNASEINAVLEKKLDEIPLPEGYYFQVAGEKESSENSFGGLGPVIVLTVFGLLAILVLEFRTFKSTLIVLSVVPLGVIGGLVTLLITGNTLSFVATIGFIALMGIEIKNSILLVDYTNQLREQGVSLETAIRDGAETRFLPILLTSMTAIGGFIPLVLEDAPLYSPLAWVLIGGLISSTLLSRIVTPVLYKLLPPRVNVRANDGLLRENTQQIEGHTQNGVAKEEEKVG